jgi:hypothetical protein
MSAQLTHSQFSFLFQDYYHFIYIFDMHFVAAFIAILAAAPAFTAPVPPPQSVDSLVASAHVSSGHRYLLIIY